MIEFLVSGPFPGYGGMGCMVLIVLIFYLYFRERK
jgi:hypothetical protein